MTFKTCTLCGLEKPEKSDFYRHGRNPSHQIIYSSKCKACIISIRRALRATCPPKPKTEKPAPKRIVSTEKVEPAYG